MTVIGFRAAPSEVTYAVVNIQDERSIIVAVEQIKLPFALSFPEQLNYIRKTVKDILIEYKISRAGIRATENMAGSLNIERISIEAILQELLSSSSIERYFVGQIASLHAKLGIPKTDFKKYVDKELNQFGAHDISDFDSKQREAVLTALACINI